MRSLLIASASPEGVEIEDDSLASILRQLDRLAVRVFRSEVLDLVADLVGRSRDRLRALQPQGQRHRQRGGGDQQQLPLHAASPFRMGWSMKSVMTAETVV